ncbi:hypothetical protein SAMN05216257_10313 [Meinhardsimonia xiamenensis]|jgi:hypothetical protein|uniref:Uncharacterized protein n=1 Tax=Meinhardsimonia xiamenensis TaxID=990712 RepID=A0A1G9C8C0_9RHOB|nr:hypothetical protein [Meinhardsimonia xiamenensis]PRX38454.1 hypothetical protein LV81_00741 [Meinhardsimonia xiamenensis]SDK47906.1 hypothetical protein SAMN05216257_10313 [Meinhardsimonia xiamenensis]
MKGRTGQNKTSGATGKRRDEAREERLKAALKANIARRKAQARARSATIAQGNTSGD